MSRSLLPVPLLLGLAACAAEPEGEPSWSLALTPHAHPNQDLTAGGPSAKLVLRGGGEDVVVPLGTVDAGAVLVAPDLPPASQLGDVTALGVALDPFGAPDDAVSPDLLAYGEVPVEGLAPGAQLAADLLVSDLGRIGDLGSLPAAQQRFLRGVALVPPGRIVLFAGGTDLQTPTSDVFELASLDAGDPWRFEKVGTLPKNGDDPPERLGLTATTVLVDGAPMVFVAGGRDTWSSTGDNSSDWWLYDPVAHDFVDHGELAVGRAEHAALLLRDGRVLLYAGYTGATGTDDPRPEIFDPARKKTVIAEVETAETGYAVASLGDAGVIVCGGLDLVSPSVARLTDQCHVLNLQGVDREVAPLPLPLGRLALAPAGDGFVLATGGFTAEGDVDPDVSVAASDGAWLYAVDDDTWTPVGPLGLARSAHAAIPLSGGRVLVVGGTATDGPLALPSGEVGCPELYDPATKSFTVLQDQCGTWGAGAFPGVATLDGEGAVLLKGYTTLEDPQDAVGFVGFGPG